ncbi:MAG: glutathione S-transferase family protein [Alphaproteobacteria bacterium]|nr:glutathione S-transferase family protein [Alphaproteobacteria bacterium]
MRTLYHLALSPQSRLIRLVLGEKRLEVHLRAEPVWERREEFLAINPAGEVPVLVEDDGTTIAGATAIAEYLEETATDPALISGEPAERAEIRRLVSWFDRKFDREVTEFLIGEKVMKRFLGIGEPSSEAIRAGHANILIHLDYIGWLAERRTWLAGDRFSLADVAAAAHLSCVDYLGDVPWDRSVEARNWYARVKSRPAFRALLADHVSGLKPAPHYADLDF